MKLNKQIYIRDRLIARGEAPYIICEMACAHEGEIKRAEKLIDAAAEAGADAIQFEMLDPDDNIIPATDMYKLLQRLYFSPDDWEHLFNYSRQYDIAVSSFAYDYKSLETALELGADLIKLNSSDLSNPDMIERIAGTCLPCTFGTGASAMEEILRSVEFYKNRGGKNLILMHGLQNFPTELHNMNIGRIKLLMNKFDCPAGYADHTDGGTALSMYIDLIALGIGASVIEKHITLNRDEKGIDHESALEPDEFMQYVRILNDGNSAIGCETIPGFSQSEITYRLFQKKKIVAARDLKSGETVSKDMIRFLRSEQPGGISPMDMENIIGARVVGKVSAYDHIHYSDIAG